MAKGKVPCDNCDGEHYSPDFPHPRDKAKIKNAKEERAARTDSGGCNGGCGGGSGGGRQGDRKKWSNDKKVGDINDSGNGVQNIVNDWMFYFCCQYVGWNVTHTSGFHAAWKHDPGTFSLPIVHDYWKLSGKTVWFRNWYSSL